MTEKLQKILSRAGIASRRALEQMIEEGRVVVNGKTANVGDRFEANEITVKIDGKVVLSPDTNQVSCRVLMYHKPEGELTTLSDPENRPTVFDHIPKPPLGRWIYIGRLDINTSGLLLFTTDGELANALMHPKYEVERIYAARIYGEVSEEQIDALTQGVKLEDGKARFNRVVYVGGEGRNAWYHVSLKEGRKREVRRLWEAVGLKVSRLIRIKYAGIDLDPNLKSGQYRELTLSEVNKLRKSVKLEPLDKLPEPMSAQGAKGAKKQSVKPKAQEQKTNAPSKNGKLTKSINKGSKVGDKKPFAKSQRAGKSFVGSDGNTRSSSFGKSSYSKRPKSKTINRSSRKPFGRKSFPKLNLS